MKLLFKKKIFGSVINIAINYAGELKVGGAYAYARKHMRSFNPFGQGWHNDLGHWQDEKGLYIEFKDGMTWVSEEKGDNQEILLDALELKAIEREIKKIKRNPFSEGSWLD